MATASVETMQEKPDTIGLAKNSNPASKRGREDGVGAGSVAEKKWPEWPGHNVFRLLVPARKVGGIIGRKGEFVKKMCEETRSRIKILEGIPGDIERIVMVFAKEEPEAAVSPAMNGLLKVHKRIIEGAGVTAELGGDEKFGGGTNSTRMLVTATQAGTLIGRHGTTIKALQESSGAIVRVLPIQDLPLCALADDRLVDIQGEIGNVHKAVELIASHLRKFLVDRSVIPLFESSMTNANQSLMDVNLSPQSWPLHQDSSLPSSGGTGLGNSSQCYYYPPAVIPPLHVQQDYGSPAYDSDPSLLAYPVANSPEAHANVQVTQQMQIPGSYADAIIGTAGANINFISKASGSTITIHETRGVPGEMTVEISGTTTQVLSAQQLIENFISGVSRPPAHAFNSIDAGYNSHPIENPIHFSPPPSTGHAGYSTTAYGFHHNSSYGL